MRLVLDTNTIVSGIGWEGPPREVLVALGAGRHALITSPGLLDELTRVLRSPRLRSLAAHPLLPVILEWLYRPEHLVIPTERITVLEADPADDLVLEAAVAGRADVIVSGDRHLLRLKQVRGVPILTARAFLARFPATG